MGGWPATGVFAWVTGDFVFVGVDDCCAWRVTFNGGLNFDKLCEFSFCLVESLSHNMYRIMLRMERLTRERRIAASRVGRHPIVG